MKKRPFLITIDTEGDNLWNHNVGEPIFTKNSLFLERFQKLCDRFGFKPTYLVNFEMVNDSNFISFAKKNLNEKKCEIGMHLHAWNSPPNVFLAERNDGYKAGHPFITEFSKETIENKVSFLTSLIKETFGIEPVTHRAGRWATNKVYAEVLENNGYKFDCSITSGISWSDTRGYSNGSFGNNYSYFKNKITDFYATSMIEFPLQSYSKKTSITSNLSSIKKMIKNIVIRKKQKQRIILRPNGQNLNDLLYIVNKNKRSTQKYLMFMLHSSELMPGGSPTFSNIESIEKLYKDLELLFSTISQFYYGSTVSEFGYKISNKPRNH